MTRARYDFRVWHPAEQRAILRRLRGEELSPQDRGFVAKAISELETLLAGRKRVRRLPDERDARKSQKNLFRGLRAMQKNQKNRRSAKKSAL